MTMWTLQPLGPEFLTEEELGSLSVLFRQIVPSDPARGIPGAEEAGAANFLAELLRRDEQTYHEIPQWRTLYRSGLAFLDAAARQRHERPLTQLSNEEATALLASLQKGELSGDVDQALLFKTLVRHCIQGCYGDPRWGGNRDKVMWRWFGYLQDAEDVR